MKHQIACKGCDLVISIGEVELPKKKHAVVRLRCPNCGHVGEYTTTDIIGDSSPRPGDVKGLKNERQNNPKVVCVLSWIPQLAQTRTWLLTANGYTVVSLLGTDGVRHLDGIENADLFVLAHSVPIREKQHAITLFKKACSSPVLSLLPPHSKKIPEADYGVEAHNPDEFVAVVNQILGRPSAAIQ